MRALITGATGLIGRQLIRNIESPVVLSRRPGEARRRLRATLRSIAWNRRRGLRRIRRDLRGTEVVFNLAGEPVSEGRWTDEKKRRIRDSRVVGTRNLVRWTCFTEEPAARAGVGVRGRLLRRPR